MALFGGGWEVFGTVASLAEVDYWTWALKVISTSGSCPSSVANPPLCEGLPPQAPVAVHGTAPDIMMDCLPKPVSQSKYNAQECDWWSCGKSMGGTILTSNVQDPVSAITIFFQF